MAHRYLLWVKFDGSRFSGFAKSGGNGYGVIDLLNVMMKFVLEPKGFEGIKLSPGSRTDASVHVVRGPVLIHTDQSKYLIDETPEKKQEFLTETNNLLKRTNNDSLELLDIHRVSLGFSPRKNISYRRYVYRLRVANTWEIYEESKRSPSIACFAERYYAWTLPPNFDFQRANEACSMFVGHHNMASYFKFSAKDQRRMTDDLEVKRTERGMDVVRVVGGEEFCGMSDSQFTYYNFEVISRSFLREQIRRMVQVVVSYAQNKIQKDTIRYLFDKPHPNTFFACKLTAAPPIGLYLVDCVYDPEMFTNPVPYTLHNWGELTEEQKSMALLGEEV